LCNGMNLRRKRRSEQPDPSVPGPSGRTPRIAKDGSKFNGGGPKQSGLSGVVKRLLSLCAGYGIGPRREPVNGLFDASKDANIPRKRRVALGWGGPGGRHATPAPA